MRVQLVSYLFVLALAVPGIASADLVTDGAIEMGIDGVTGQPLTPIRLAGSASGSADVNLYTRPVPEPSAWLLAGLGVLVRRRLVRRSRAPLALSSRCRQPNRACRLTTRCIRDGDSRPWQMSAAIRPQTSVLRPPTAGGLPARGAARSVLTSALDRACLPTHAVEKGDADTDRSALG